MVVTGVGAAGENSDTVFSAVFVTYALVPFSASATYDGIQPTSASETAVSPETSIDVLAPGLVAPFPLSTMATCVNPGFGGLGITGVATGR
jgi:hypothetical protein